MRPYVADLSPPVPIRRKCRTCGNNLGVQNPGNIHFQYNVAHNTGRSFEVGYVYREGQRELFCKRQPSSSEDGFYLCNEFRSLEVSR